MHRFQIAAMAAVFFGATCALAEEPNVAERAGGAVKDAAEATGDAVKGAAEVTGDAVKGAAQKTGEVLGITGGDAVTAEQAAQYEGAEHIEHEMTGTIVSVDKATGAVDLKTANGTMRVHFPVASVQNLSDGQPLNVELAFVELPIAEGGTRAYDNPRDDDDLGEHWMRGKVDNIDRSTGKFDFKSGDLTLNLHFPPSQIETLANGDEIALELSFEQPKRI